jgi:hypothetical protein
LILESGTFRELADPRRPRGSVFFLPEYARGIDQRRAVPDIRWVAVAAGVLVAVAVASVLRLAGPPTAAIFGSGAPLCGIAPGAFLAGKMAKYAGIYHGALVGAGYVLVEMIGLAPALIEVSGDALGDTLSIIGADAILLALAALAGWIGAPRAASSSSSGKGRGP